MHVNEGTVRKFPYFEGIEELNHPVRTKKFEVNMVLYTIVNDNIPLCQTS